MVSDFSRGMVSHTVSSLPTELDWPGRERAVVEIVTCARQAFTDYFSQLYFGLGPP